MTGSSSDFGGRKEAREQFPELDDDRILNNFFFSTSLLPRAESTTLFLLACLVPQDLPDSKPVENSMLESRLYLISIGQLHRVYLHKF